MREVLEINQLSKQFGRIQAVNQLNLKIKKGQVYGILGPNGSGKTTTLGMILDVIAPTSGGFRWFGGENTVQARKKIGSILETPCFYPYLSAVQNLKITAHIKECDPDGIGAILDQVNLGERKNDKFKEYSLGMKQRLSIAAALLSNPPVLILDEPTNGLDPEGIAEVREIIGSIAQEGKTIIIASHLLDEVQKVCTHFCVLRKGVKLHEGGVREILGETNIVEVDGKDIDHLENLLNTFKGIHQINRVNGILEVELAGNKQAQDVNQFCFEKGLTLSRLVTRRNSLEHEFLKILKEND